MDGWNTRFLSGWPIFRCELIVFGEGYTKTFNLHEANCLFQDLWKLLKQITPTSTSPNCHQAFWTPSEHHFLREWNSEDLLQISSSLPPNKAPEPVGRLPVRWVKSQRFLTFMKLRVCKPAKTHLIKARKIDCRFARTWNLKILLLSRWHGISFHKFLIRPRATQEKDSQ